MQRLATRLSAIAASTSALPSSSSSWPAVRALSQWQAASKIPNLQCTCHRSTRSRRRPYSSVPLPGPLRHPESNASTASTTSSFTPAYPATIASGYGQPLPSTHPHLLKHGELTEGIPYAEYEARRKALMDRLPDRSIVVLPGNRLQYSSQSIFHKFRQNSDFFYLTGWLEPDAALILEKNSSLRGYSMTIFCQSRDAEQELWEGPRNGPNGAVDVFGADKALDIQHFTSHLRTLLSSSADSISIFADLPDNPTASIRAPRGIGKAAKSIVNFLSGSSSGGAQRTALDLGMSSRKSDYDAVLSMLNGSTGRSVKSLREQVEVLRMVKSDNEVKLMRKAADISGNAHAKVMRIAEAGMNENTLVSNFEFYSAVRGAARQAYVPVCASGANARYLHYTCNNAVLGSEDLVLIDAGCRFTDPQKDLYQAILNTIKTCTKACTERASVTLYDLHDKSRSALIQELRQIGLDLRHNDALLNRIYPHFVGHPLGLDLHDCPTFQRHTPLKAGNVVTIEPGVFIPDDPAVPAHFRNTAIRLEDEVLVGKDHPIVLSVDAPREVVDVELDIASTAILIMSKADSRTYLDLDRARAIVDAKSTELDERVIAPARHALSQASSQYPFTTIFTTVLVALAFVPVVTFLAFSAVVVLSLLAGCAIFFLFWTAILLGAAAFVLLFAIGFAISIAGTVTSVAIAVSVARTLYDDVKQRGSLNQGISKSLKYWTTYTLETYSNAITFVQHSRTINLQQTHLTGHANGHANGTNGHSNGYVTIGNGHARVKVEDN